MAGIIGIAQMTSHPSLADKDEAIADANISTAQVEDTPSSVMSDDQAEAAPQGSSPLVSNAGVDIYDPAQDTAADDSEASRAQSQQDAVEAAAASVTPEALDSGNPQRWKAKGKSGYVVPSAAQDYGGRVCRNIFVTTIDRGEQSQSASRQWCQPAVGSNWLPS